MSTNPAKRTRFNATAVSPADRATTPMAAAKQSLDVHCESLHPEIATILSKLGLERLQTFHKLSHKSTQVKKIEDDEEFIPRSARINFALSASKPVEQDAEYIRLAEETSDLVTNFQNELKTKILSVAKLEVSTLKTKIKTDFATSLRLATQACLICKKPNPDLNVNQVVNTLLNKYSNDLLAYLDTNLHEFRTIFQRTHAIASLPAPLILTIPNGGPDNRNTARPASALPSQAVLLAISKVYRTLQTIFLTPWSVYLDVQNRNNISLQIKKLSETHFATNSTDAAAMIVDNKAADEPQLIKDLIAKQVTSATKALQSELKTLRSQVTATKPAKNAKRGPSRASNKKQNGNRAAAAPKDTVVAKPNKSSTAKQGKRQTKSSSNKPNGTSQRKPTSRRASSKS